MSVIPRPTTSPTLRSNPSRSNRPVVLVTGAARGIGAATVEALASDGWHVIALDVCDTGVNTSTGPEPPSQADLSAVVKSVGAAATAVVADVCDGVRLAEVASQVVNEHGRLDAVVAAAGVVAGGRTLWETERHEWDAVISTDLTGVWLTMRAVIPHILVSPGPRRAVAVASAAGSRGLPLMGAYAAAKHGVIGLVRSLAADLAGTGTTANVVSPGSTEGVLLDAAAKVYGLANSEEFTRHQIPLGRLISSDEVAAAIRWLCTPEAAAVTGSVLAIDGGMTSVVH